MISTVGFAVVSVGEDSKSPLPSHLQEGKALGILIFTKALLLPVMGTLVSIIRTLPHHQFFTKESVRAWRAAFFLCATSSSGASSHLEESPRELFVQGVSLPSLSVPASHPLASDLHHLIPSSWLDCSTSGDSFLMQCRGVWCV